MGRVYIDTCSTILLGKVNTYNFKKLPVGSTIVLIVITFKINRNHFSKQNCRARGNANATHAKKSSFRKTLIYYSLRYSYSIIYL